ncbi:MAG: glycosyltransferase family 4 protein [Candidatus Kariarchaeaceae archaeon]
MRIVLITERFYPLYGGAETRFGEIAHHLANKGHEITIITGQGDITEIDPHSHLFSRIEKHRGYKIWRSFNYKKSNLFHGRRSLQNCMLLGGKSAVSLRKLQREGEIDIVDINIMPHLHLPLFRLLRGNPSIVTWHEVWGKEWRKQPGFAKFGQEIELLNAQLGKERIAVSKFTAKRLQRISYRNNHPIHVVENGVSDQFFNVENIGDENPHFLYVGRLIPEKNLHTLLMKGFNEILKRYPKATLDIVGHGSLRNIITRFANLRSNVTYHGNVSFEELLNIFAQTNIFVLPSSREGSGISAIEANAAGLPVVTVDFPNNATAHEYISNNNNGIVASPQNFSFAMEQAYENRDQLSKNSRLMAKKFRWKDLTIKIEEIYERISSYQV